jgi:hypothetical protein
MIWHVFAVFMSVHVIGQRWLVLSGLIRRLAGSPEALYVHGGLHPAYISKQIWLEA